MSARGRARAACRLPANSAQNFHEGLSASLAGTRVKCEEGKADAPSGGRLGGFRREEAVDVNGNSSSSSMEEQSMLACHSQLSYSCAGLFRQGMLLSHKMLVIEVSFPTCQIERVGDGFIDFLQER
jgi:hypothetical protein